MRSSAASSGGEKWGFSTSTEIAEMAAVSPLPSLPSRTSAADAAICVTDWGSRHSKCTQTGTQTGPPSVAVAEWREAEGTAAEGRVAVGRMGERREAARCCAESSRRPLREETMVREPEARDATMMACDKAGVTMATTQAYSGRWWVCVVRNGTPTGQLVRCARAECVRCMCERA